MIVKSGQSGRPLSSRAVDDSILVRVDRRVRDRAVSRNDRTRVETGRLRASVDARSRSRRRVIVGSLRRNLPSRLDTDGRLGVVVVRGRCVVTSGYRDSREVLAGVEERDVTPGKLLAEMVPSRDVRLDRVDTTCTRVGGAGEVRGEDRRGVTFVVGGAGGLDVVGREGLVTTGCDGRLVRVREIAGTDVDRDMVVLRAGVDDLART